MINKLRLTIVYMGLFGAGFVHARPVPEMDVGGVPVAIGLTVALVLLVRDRLKR
jgi:hypothetical protein